MDDLRPGTRFIINLHIGMAAPLLTPSCPLVARLTQLLAAEAQAGRVLVEVLVEVDAQAAQLLLDGFDLLQVVGEEGEEHRDQSEPVLLRPGPGRGHVTSSPAGSLGAGAARSCGPA